MRRRGKNNDSHLLFDWNMLHRTNIALTDSRLQFRDVFVQSIDVMPTKEGTSNQVGETLNILLSRTPRCHGCNGFGHTVQTNEKSIKLILSGAKKKFSIQDLLNLTLEKELVERYCER